SDVSKCVLVVSIPTSSLRPHIDAPEGKFWVRGEGGSARPMGFFEVRDQMLYTAGRLQKVTLLRLELASIMRILGLLYAPETRSARFDTSAYMVLLADICDLLQPDHGLLEMLHGIGTDAKILNPLLDKEEYVRNMPQQNPYMINQMETDNYARRN